MKKTLILLLPVSALFIMLTAFYPANPVDSNPSIPGDEFSIPEDVSVILDNKCFGCHNVEAKSDKAKKKLLIDQMGELSKSKLVAKLGDIGKVIEKNEMPPSKFLENYPDKALTEDETKKLKAWTDSAAEELMK